MFRGERLKIHPVTMPVPAPRVPDASVTGDVSAMGPGVVVATKRVVLVGTASGPLQLGMVQPHGKKPMTAADWARGFRIEPGEKFADV